MKNKSVLYLILTFLFIQSAFSQIQSGKLIYRAKDNIVIEKTLNSLKNNPEITYNIQIENGIKQQLQQLKRLIPYLQFSLKFNKEAALFQTLKSMNNDNGVNPNRAAKDLAIYGLYYTNISNNESLKQLNTYNESWIIQQNNSSPIWTITQKSKTIQGYNCKKAFAEVLDNNHKKIKIEAWFCPSLPFYFGPIGYSGLPGLILELDYKNITFYADKIQLSENSRQIKKPTKGKKVSFEEFQKERKKRIRQLKKYHAQQKR